MTSIWTDLLYLHGYLIDRSTLQWRADAPQRTESGTAPGQKAPASDACQPRPGDCVGPACA